MNIETQIQLVIHELEARTGKRPDTLTLSRETGEMLAKQLRIAPHTIDVYDGLKVIETPYAPYGHISIGYSIEGGK